MRRIAITSLLCGVLAFTGCGGPEGGSPSPTPTPRTWDRVPATPTATPSAAVGNKHLSGGPYPGPLLTQVTREPSVRVRVRSNVAELHILSRPSQTASGVAGSNTGDSGGGGGGGGVRVSGLASSGAKVYRYRLPLRVSRSNGAWVIRDGAGQSVRWPLPELLIECDDGGTMRVGEANYPNRLALTPRFDQRGQEVGRFDTVNHVPLETYLPGVIERELYANWPEETFKAQAVAARSYALWEMTIASGRHFDLESTTASQVYGGQGSNPTALQAVRDTRGQVLAYAGRVLPAFFASSTGGLGQDALIAFPNRIENLPPLYGREHGAWDQASPSYRWGPVSRDTATLSKRIAAWGKRQKHPAARLGKLQRIEVSARNRVGRPAQFTLTDTAGQRIAIGCEMFRNACNFTREGEIPLGKKQKLLSSHVDVVVGGGTQFTNGRGHGHGVGMSQWGAQAMAKAGHGYAAILQFYYPGATVRKVY